MGFNQIQYRLCVVVCSLQMCVCFSESARRLAFSWAPHRVLGNKYGNLSMRASLLSGCFCLLHSLVKYHFSINILIANCTIGAFANRLLFTSTCWLGKYFPHKCFQFVQSCLYAGMVMIDFYKWPNGGNNFISTKPAIKDLCLIQCDKWIYCDTVRIIISQTF